MSSEVIIDVKALENVSQAIKNYITKYRETIGNAKNQILSNGVEWDDEDFAKTAAAMQKLYKDFDEIELAANNLLQRIESRITQIHQLHNMKI